MKPLALLLLMSFFDVSLTAAGDVTGAWTIDFRRAPTDAFSSAVCTFVQTEQKLTGDCGSDALPRVVSGTVADGHVSWQFKSGIDDTIIAMFDGELDERAATMEGSWSFVDSSDGTTGTGIFQASKQ